MKITYPPLVEQSFKEMRLRGLNVTKQEVYTKMVESHLIDENGQPTQFALDNGLVDEFQPDINGDYEPVTLIAFKRYYPEYAQFSDSHFTHTERGWAVDAYVVRALANQTLNDPDSTLDARQSAYELLRCADEMED